MSLYDNASLVMIPSGVKEDKLYSIKPTDGSGDFTFSRGSDIQATRVNSSGLIEKAKVNLLLQSNSFDTTWSLSTNITLTSGQSGYDGSSDAWECELTTSGAFKAISQSVSHSGVNTFSVYAKAGTISKMSLRSLSGTDAVVIFDLSSGTIEAINANAITGTMTDAGGGWYRCTMTYSASQSNVYIYFNDITTPSIGTIYIQDAQLNHGLVAQDYIETTTTAVVEGLTADLPRLDYSGGASCPSLLLEPSRTNIQTNSEYVDAYVKSRSTITTNATTSPEGVSNASKVIPLSTSTGWSGVNAPNHSFTSGQTYTLSVFAKAGEYNYCQVGGSTPAFNGSFATINLTNGVVEHQSGITATTEDYGSGWWRISFSHTAIATASSPIGFFAVYSTAVSSRLVTQVGDDTSGVYMYGWMAEQGSYPTSYIPTYGTATVRGADNSFRTDMQDFLGTNTGSWFFHIKDMFFDITGTGVGSFRLSQNSSNLIEVVADGNFKYLITLNNSNAITQLDGEDKVCMSWDSNGFVIYINGEERYTSSSSAYSSPYSGFDLNTDTRPSRVDIKKMLFFPTRLTNAELASLTTI